MKNRIFLRNLIIIFYPVVFIFLYYKFTFFQKILSKFVECLHDKANAVIVFMLVFIFAPELIVILISKYIWRE